MKILKQEEVDKAADEYSNKQQSYVGIPHFKAGVELAESKVEEVVVEFVNWVLENKFDEFGQCKKDSKELFKEFLKERYND